MHFLRYSKTTFLFILLAACIGCKSKQEKPVQSQRAPQATAVPPSAIIPPDKPGTPVVPAADKADAQAAALRVLALMENGDFSAVYRGADDGFKQIGTESQFVAKFQDVRKNVGALKNPVVISLSVLPNHGYALVYRLQNERYKTDLRLTLARTKDGKMQLVGLNQHDELKK